MAILARAYEGAKLGRRTEGWVAAGTGANAEIAPAIARLRDRSRDLVRNNPYAAKAVQALVSNMVGTGLLPRARAAMPELAAGRPALGGVRRLGGRRRRPHRLRRPAGADRPRLVESGEVLVRSASGGSRTACRCRCSCRCWRPTTSTAGKTDELRDGGFVLQGIEFDALGRPPRLLALPDASRRRPRRRWSRIGRAGRPRAAPLRAAAARAGARRAVVRAGDAEAARPRRLRRGRAGAEEDRGLLRRLRHRRAGRGDPRQGADRSRRQPDRDLRARDDRVPRARARREVRDAPPPRAATPSTCGCSCTRSPPASGSPTSC